MSSSKSCRDYVLEQLSEINGITYRMMMGEYLLYYQGVLFGGIYDNRLLVKKTQGNAKYHLSEIVPYPNAKAMFFLEDVDNQEMLADVVLTTVNDLRKD